MGGRGQGVGYVYFMDMHINKQVGFQDLDNLQQLTFPCLGLSDQVTVKCISKTGAAFRLTSTGTAF